MIEIKDKSTVKLRPGFSMREMGLASYRLQNTLIYGQDNLGFIMGSIVAGLVNDYYDLISIDSYSGYVTGWSGLSNVDCSIIDKGNDGTAERLVKTALWIVNKLNHSNEGSSCHPLSKAHIILIDSYEDLIDAYGHEAVDKILDFIMGFGPSFGVYTIICVTSHNDDNEFLFKNSSLRLFACSRQGLDTDALSHILFRNGLQFLHVHTDEKPNIIEKLNMVIPDTYLIRRLVEAHRLTPYDNDELDLFYKNTPVNEDELIYELATIIKTIDDARKDDKKKRGESEDSPILEMKIMDGRVIACGNSITDAALRSMWED